MGINCLGASARALSRNTSCRAHQSTVPRIPMGCLSMRQYDPPTCPIMEARELPNQARAKLLDCALIPHGPCGHTGKLIRPFQAA